MDDKELNITAELANLELSPAERTAFEDEVGRMLEYFELMNGIDVEGVEATTHVGVRGNRTRQDVAGNKDVSEGILKNSPDRQDRFFRIPRVL